MSYIVCYFSASGVTASVAKNISELVDATLLEIKPEQKYTEKDLNYYDSNSRSSQEMADKNCRPKIKNIDIDFSKFDLVYLGFPNWWDDAPRVIYTFLEKYKIKGDLVLFCTSGGSGIENVLNNLRNTFPNLNIIKAKRLKNNIEDIKKIF